MNIYQQRRDRQKQLFVYNLFISCTFCFLFLVSTNRNTSNYLDIEDSIHEVIFESGDFAKIKQNEN